MKMAIEYQRDHTEGVFKMGKQRQKHKKCERYGCTRLAGKAGYCQDHALSSRIAWGEGYPLRCSGNSAFIATVVKLISLLTVHQSTAKCIHIAWVRILQGRV